MALLVRVVGPLAGDAAEPARRRLGRLEALTAGDFASSARRLALVGRSGASALLDALEEEHALKNPGTSRRVGFR